MFTEMVFMLFFQYLKDLTKKPPKLDKNKRRKAPAQEELPENDGDVIELDTNLHCRDLTVRELEFSMVCVCVCVFLTESRIILSA